MGPLTGHNTMNTLYSTQWSAQQRIKHAEDWADCNLGSVMILLASDGSHSNSRTILKSIATVISSQLEKNNTHMWLNYPHSHKDVLINSFPGLWEHQRVMEADNLMSMSPVASPLPPDVVMMSPSPKVQWGYQEKTHLNTQGSRWRAGTF